jgi:hypothetical protein
MRLTTLLGDLAVGADAVLVYLLHVANRAASCSCWLSELHLDATNLPFSSKTQRQNDLYTIMPLVSIMELLVVLVYLGHFSGCFFYLLSTPPYQMAGESAATTHLLLLLVLGLRVRVHQLIQLNHPIKHSHCSGKAAD